MSDVAIEDVMHPDLKNVAEHMKNLGLGALTHAMRLSLCSYPGNPFWGELSVLHGAHPAEIPRNEAMTS